MTGNTLKTKSEKFPIFSRTVGAVVLELLKLVVVVVGTVVVVLVDVDVDDENEDSTKPLRMLMMKGSSGDTAVVDVVDAVVAVVVVAGELVVNFSRLLRSFLFFGIFVGGETRAGL